VVVAAAVVDDVDTMVDVHAVVCLVRVVGSVVVVQQDDDDNNNGDSASVVVVELEVNVMLIDS
jgi:hypothetical protein